MKTFTGKDGLVFCAWCGKRCLTKEESITTIRAIKRTDVGKKYMATKKHWCSHCGWWHLCR